MSAVCRRTLLKGAAATCGTGLLAACAGGEGSAPAAPAPAGAAPPAGGASRASLGRLADVPVGGAVAVDAPDGGTVLLTRPSDGEVRAFSAVCPHEGCQVGVDGDGFSCPCHGSAFELDGSLRRGPAERGLASYDVQVVDGQVLPA